MPVITTSIGSKIALCALALAFAGGGAAAAVAAAPQPVSTASAASVVHAPEPTDSAAPAQSGSATDEIAVGTEAKAATGPDVTGPAAFGLCTAYLAGGLAAGSAPAAALVAVAGEDGVAAYCELVVASGPPQSQGDEHEKPAARPAAPVLPEQSTQGVSHRPTERPGR
jgi:hypothetical protein